MISMEDLNSVQIANDSRRVRSVDVSGNSTCTFPAPATGGRQGHGFASAGGMPGLWAYTSNTSIVVIKPAELPRTWPIFQMLDGSGWDQYTSVSFCQASVEKWPIPRAPLVTASRGGLVRIFDIDDNATVKFHTCHSEHRTIAEWSPRSNRLIYAADDIGQLSIWDVVENSCALLSFMPLNTTALAVSPHEDEIVALGDKDGSIRIINTSGTGTLLHYINSEDIGEVFSLGWKPFGNWSTVTKLRKHVGIYLAASFASFKPPVVKIIDRGGCMVQTINMPSNEASPRKLVNRRVPSLWIRLPEDPSKPDEDNIGLVCVGNMGEIFVWKNHGLEPELIHEVHRCSSVFALVQAGDILWTIAAEPYIAGWNLAEKKIETIIPTYAGICSISISSSEQSRIAIGGVDSYVRVLKMASEYPNQEVPEMPTVPYRLQGKVTAVAWHPYQDKIGLGLDNGTIGVFDMKGESRYVVLFAKSIEGTVYTMDWGPRVSSDSFTPKERKRDEAPERDSLFLYACSNRRAFAIHPGRRDNSLINISRIIAAGNDRLEARAYVGITEIKWSPDRLYFAVGYTDGKIEIYIPPYLKLRCWIQCHSNAIQYMSWRSLDFVQGKKEKFFASAANDGTAKIYDLAQLYDPEFMSNPDEELEFISSSTILNGHRGLRVIQVEWSPHNDNHVLTVSYDRTAVIWNLKDKTRIARYMGHEHRLVACAFHPTNPYIILTCSDEMITDSCFHMWDYREHPETDNYQEKMAALSMNDLKVESVKALAAPIPKLMFRPGLEDAAVGKDKKGNIPVRQDADSRLMSKIRERLSLLPLLASRKFSEVLSDIMVIRPREFVGLTPFEESLIKLEEEASNNMDKVAIIVKEKEKEARGSDLDNYDAFYHFGLFYNRSHVLSIVEIELDRHIKREDWYSATRLLSWIPNPQPFIEKILAAGYIDGCLVTFATKCSTEFYKKVVLDWAMYLIANGRFQQGIFCYWEILGDFDATYAQLVNNGWFLEALVFSKLYRFTDLAKEDFDTLCQLATALQQRSIPSSVLSGLYKKYGYEYEEGEEDTTKDVVGIGSETEASVE